MPPPPPLSDLAEIVLRAPGIEVHVSPYGATVTKILVPDRDGVVDDVALGYDDLASYQRGDDRPAHGEARRWSRFALESRVPAASSTM